ncbi:sporulation histidine kinase inhibitor Sda [Paenibacillus sp. KS-LC4]
MELMSDDFLKDTYYAAVQSKLDQEFIQMLLFEMKRRQLTDENVRITA